MSCHVPPSEAKHRPTSIRSAHTPWLRVTTIARLPGPRNAPSRRRSTPPRRSTCSPIPVFRTPSRCCAMTARATPMRRGAHRVPTSRSGGRQPRAQSSSSRRWPVASRRALRAACTPATSPCSRPGLSGWPRGRGRQSGGGPALRRIGCKAFARRHVATHGVDSRTPLDPFSERDHGIWAVWDSNPGPWD